MLFLLYLKFGFITRVVNTHKNQEEMERLKSSRNFLMKLTKLSSAGHITSIMWNIYKKEIICLKH